jgi:hypothetical protein
VISSPAALRRSWLLYQLWCVARERRGDRLTLLLGPGVSGADVKAAAKGASLRYSTAGSQADQDAIIAEVVAAGRADARLRGTSRDSLSGDVYAAFDAAVAEAVTSAVARPCPDVPQTPRAAHAAPPPPPTAAAAPPKPAAAAALFGRGPGGKVSVALRDLPEPVAPPPQLLAALMAHSEDGLAVLIAARSKFRCNGERLVGMLAQFDGADRVSRGLRARVVQ